MPFSTLRPFSLNRGVLPAPLGLLRVIATSALIALALQFVVPVVLRLALNAGRVYFSDDTHSLWGEVLPWPVLSIPAWLTIASVVVAVSASTAYLALGGTHVRADIPYITMTTLLFAGFFPFLIATFDKDPTGILSTPGEAGYPIGWHWIASPLALLVIVGAIVGAVRARVSAASARAR